MIQKYKLMRVYDSFIQQFHRSRNNLIEYLPDIYRSLDRKIFSKKNLWKDVDSGQMESVQRERERKKMDMYRYVLHGVKNRASSTVEQSPSTLEAGRSCAKGVVSAV